jgi:hypothetical protein
MERIKKFQDWLSESETKITDKDEKTVKDILSLPYPQFVDKLKANADDPKVQTILNMGKKDGIPTDEVIKVDDTAMLDVSKLLPTQSQIGLADSIAWLAKNKPEGAEKLIKGDTSTFNDNRILTANGKYILDGHHRWSQVFLFNPKAKIPAIDLKLPGIKETDLLKVIQVAIAATYKDLHKKAADSETDIFDDKKMSEEKIREKLPELMGKTAEISKKAYGAKDVEEVYDKIVQNALELKKRKPSKAPEREYMPQPSDTAELAGKSKEEISDFKGMPSEFIDKLKSGKVNFKAPLV